MFFLCGMTSYFEEHDCAPLAEGAAPDELLQFARWGCGQVEGRGKQGRKEEKRNRWGEGNSREMESMKGKTGPKKN